MNNLLNFLTKYKTVFLFLILQFLAFLLIVQNNQYQKSYFLNVSSFMIGTIHSCFKDISIYFSLKEENHKLAEENALLREKLKKVEYTLIPPYRFDTIADLTLKENFGLDTLILDNASNTNYLPALAISNSTNKKLNYIYLNKGKIDGVDKDMGVIESNGVIGIVVNVSTHYSLVMPITNIKSSLSVKIKTQNYFGSLKWNHVDYRYAEIIEVPNHVELQIGDTIVTSGYSQIFPEGELIGFVDASNKVEGSSYLNLRIKLAVDFAKINHCYVVDNFTKKELQNLSIE